MITPVPVEHRSVLLGPGQYRESVETSPTGLAATYVEYFRKQSVEVPEARWSCLAFAAWWQSVADAQARLQGHMHDGGVPGGGDRR